MEHGPMVSSGVGHRTRRRLSRDSPEPLLPRRRPFDSPSSRSMDLASIRARRARLEALTASIKLPPLVPSDVLPTSPPGARMSPLSYSRVSMMPDSPLRRITWDDRPLTGMTSPDPRLPPTLPRMATPHQPLPSIGHTREALGFTPEEEEEEEHGAGQNGAERDGEAGYSNTREITHGDHPPYPVLHDPLAPLPAPTRPSPYPPATPSAHHSSPQQPSSSSPPPPLQPSTPAQSSPPPLPTSEHSSPPSSPLPPPRASTPLPPQYRSPYTPPPALRSSLSLRSYSLHRPSASPPPQSPSSPPPLLPQTFSSPSPNSSPTPQSSSPPPPPPSSPPPQLSSPPPASSQPSSPVPQSPQPPQVTSPQPTTPTEEAPPTDPSPPPTDPSPPPTDPSPPTAEDSSPTQPSPTEVPSASQPPSPSKEISPSEEVSQPSSPSPASPTNLPTPIQSLKPNSPLTTSSPRPTIQASSRPNSSPASQRSPATQPAPSSSSAPKSPSSAPPASSSAAPQKEEEEEVATASESISLSSYRRPKSHDPSELGTLVAKMSSADGATRTAATVRVRQLLSSSRGAPIDEMLRLGVLTPAYNNLHDNNPAIQYETVWIITNIVSGTAEQTQAVADKGFIPVLVQLVAAGEPWVKEQAAWALGNMAADTSQIRNQIVEAGALRPLADLTKPQAKVSSLHKVVWALSNIFKLKDLKAPGDDLLYVLETFRDHLLVHRDEEVVADTLWTLTYLTDAGGSEAIEQVVEVGLLPLLVSHLSSRSRQVVYPAIRTLGTIVSGTDSQTEAALDAGMLPPLHAILREPREARRTKEATWALSNITAGTTEQIQKVVDEGFLHTLVHLIREGVVEVSREAVWAVSNLVAGGDSEQVAALVEAGGPGALLTTLHPQAPHRLDLITVDTLLTVMEKTEGDAAVKGVEEAGGVETLKGKLKHEDEEVVERVSEILETYFPDALSGDEDEDEDEEKDEEKEEEGEEEEEEVEKKAKEDDVEEVMLD
ncbi:uncharacterized protein LOC126995862 isoform X2 [Eriocheir sinensis]|uniref:uncharacterized protein LOC126995862 isoform X2 n=1 Tax=Eriocheir sinensis TaxID=95602 RepID=UPI0021C79613|nr:uncharacterized protein LOC126995862 isoform X2 [Eriocheir sinensis]